MRVLTIIGNRPQFIKAAPVSSALASAGIDEVVVHTGQHYDREMSDVFFEELGIAPPAHRITLGTADIERMRPAIEAIATDERPDWVLVFGDTNSTLAGALAAGDTPVAHIEAGLRSFDLTMPEERNRIEVDRISSLLLCPDDRSARQLRSEGITATTEVIGDVMADAHRIFGPIAARRSRILERLDVEPGQYLLVTVHREANVDPARLARIVGGLRRLDERIVFPAHPRTRAVLGELEVDWLDLCPPLGYLDFTALLAQARVALTDSGGVQKEAYWSRIPCVTLRPNTEWVDTVEAGANILVGDDPDAIVAAVAHATFPEDAPILYGDGHAADRVAAGLYASRP